MPEEKKKGTILVADDDDSIRLAMIKMLKKEGYEVGIAIDGRDTLETTARRKFDLMFLDIKMPGFNGLDVLTLMKASRPDMPIVIISGVADDAYKKRALELGAAGYITKPFGPKEIIKATTEILAAHREPAPETPSGELAGAESAETEPAE